MECCSKTKKQEKLNLVLILYFKVLVLFNYGACKKTGSSLKT
jgi:hypothetical protein